MNDDEEQRLSNAIRDLLGHMPAEKQVSMRELLKELAPKFERVSLEDLSDALAKHCTASGRRFSKDSGPIHPFSSKRGMRAKRS